MLLKIFVNYSLFRINLFKKRTNFEEEIKWRAAAGCFIALSRWTGRKVRTTQGTAPANGWE